VGINIGISTSSGTGPHIVYGNTVDSLYSNDVANSAQQLYGISVSPSSGTASVSRNIVRNQALTSSVTNAYLTGIYVGGTTGNIFNNMVSDIKTPAVTNSTNVNTVGIYASATTSNFYNNTVYLNATSTGANFGSAALEFGSGITNPRQSK
jgi:hypothetical protein